MNYVAEVHRRKEGFALTFPGFEELRAYVGVESDLEKSAREALLDEMSLRLAEGLGIPVPIKGKGDWLIDIHLEDVLVTVAVDKTEPKRSHNAVIVDSQV